MDAESKLRCKVNPLFLRREDWRRKVSRNDSFVQPHGAPTGYADAPFAATSVDRLYIHDGQAGPFSKLKIVPNASGA